ncbi:MAG: dihydroorotase [Clostridium sp.]|nr:dihydroorotase [Clostridium sp.]
MQRTIITHARFAGETSADSWILIENDRIKEIGRGEAPKDCGEEFDARGMLAMPGAIDCHVHFRQPGMEHKADIASESFAALAGGVTSYMDMPNNKPATVTIADWGAKMRIAEEHSCINYSFFIGATNDNIDELRAADYTRIPGVKLFMGSSTGNMLVDDQRQIEEIFATVGAIVAVHAEDQGIISGNAAMAKEKYADGEVPVAEHSRIRSVQACYAATAKAVELALKHRHRLHICHLTTAAELELLQDGRPQDKIITSEVSPHHLIFCDEDYGRLGARIKMNPAVKSAADREALRRALADGKIDMVATDHAPHLLSEKKGDALTAVSGAPAVQFSLPLMLDFFDEGTVRRAMCEAPAEVYGIVDRGALRPGAYADIALIDCSADKEIADAGVLSKCGWTPYAGMRLRHEVKAVFVNGKLAYSGGKMQARNAMPLRFGGGINA